MLIDGTPKYELSTKEQIAKLLICTIAGFAATKLTENVVVSYFENKHNVKISV